MSPRAAVAVLVVVFAPLLVAASDPPGDVVPCPDIPGSPPPLSATAAPDLVDATGQIAELGTSAVWILTFDQPLVVPDATGRPFRVDIVLRDPDVPPVRVGFYGGLNRLVRFDAVRDPAITIALLPERAQERFTAPEIDGATMTFRVPGRILSADEDESGTTPGLQRLRWGVVVRDGSACDLLGRAAPTQRFETGASGPVPSTAAATDPAGTEGSGGLPPWIAFAVAALVLAVGRFLLLAFLERSAGRSG
jgi:hypothetical protein